MDAGAYIDGVNSGTILRNAQEDLFAAMQAREGLEDRKLEALKNYAAWDDTQKDGGKLNDAEGPFGWSKMKIPLGFWTTEGIVPRTIQAMPRPVVKPCNIPAAPLMDAAQIRLERSIERAEPINEVILATKETSIYGNGPLKCTWDAARHAAKITAISWWNFWISQEATSYRDAECIFHLTWHTKRQLERLATLKGPDGGPLFVGLDGLWDTGGDKSVVDRTWMDRRDVSGLATALGGVAKGQVPLMECWYDDGSRVILGGVGFERLVHARVTPYRDDQGRPFRPFVVMEATPWLGMPYSLGDQEMVKDYQQEITTIRNQHIDQMTANINAPVVYSDDIPESKVKRAFSRPGQVLKVKGATVRDSIARVLPGASSQDPVQLTDMVLSEAQRVTGLSDIASGQTSGLGLTNDTATGAQLAVQEGNKRWEFRQQLANRSMAELYRMIHWHDRRFMALDIPVPLVGRDTMPPDGAEGVVVDESGKIAVVSASCNGWVFDPASGPPQRVDEPDVPYYDIDVESGTAVPQSQRERAQNALAFAGLVGQVPQLASAIDWSVFAKEVAGAFGFNPERILMAAPAGGAVDGQLNPGDTPIGPPTPVGPDGTAAIAAGAPAGGELAALPAPAGPGATPALGPPQEAGGALPVPPEVLAAFAGQQPGMNGDVPLEPGGGQAPPFVANLIIEEGAIQIQIREGDTQIEVAEGAVQANHGENHIRATPGPRRITLEIDPETGRPVGALSEPLPEHAPFPPA